MTEKERTIYAKKYIDMLANGINPIDGSTLPDSDIVNNIHIARCLFYVSGLLDRIINSANNKSAKKQPFQINDEEVGRITLSNTPIAASELAKRINNAVKNSDVKKLTYQNIISWLASINLLVRTIRVNSEKRKSVQPRTETSLAFLLSKDLAATTFHTP